MRHSQVDKGRRAREVVEFTTVEGVPCRASFRPLDGEMEGDALAMAESYAAKKGAKDPRPGHPLWELGYEVATLVLGMVDADEGSDEGVPYWESAAQVSKALDRDRIAILFEEHCTFQDKVSPRKGRMSRDEYFAKVFEIAGAEEGDISPFRDLRPASQRILLRTMAVQLSAFWTPRLSDTSVDETSGRST